MLEIGKQFRQLNHDNDNKYGGEIGDKCVGVKGNRPGYCLDLGFSRA